MAEVFSIYLQDIYVYPIKSLGGIRLKSSHTELRGLPYDRRWLLVDKKNSFLTQRKHSNMAYIKVHLKEEGLEVMHIKKSLPVLKIPFSHIPQERISVTVFDDQVNALLIDYPGVKRWFSEALEEEVILVHMDALAKRNIDPEYATNGEEVSFADGYPYLVTNQASLEDLNSRLPVPVPMDRFRPNFVVNGARPYEEDGWKKVSIGSAVFKVIKPCGRCIVTTIDQQTAEKGVEPLKTLSTYRKRNSKTIFGMNLILEKPGKIHIKDEVKIEF